jgi:hypothetical protein
MGKYETHGLTKAEEDKTNPSEVAGRDVVRYLDTPNMLCWGDFTERLADGRSWVHRCMREGDFTETAGLCPQHYEEVTGRATSSGE